MNSRKVKDKGRAAENGLVALLNAHGFTGAERRRLRGRYDEGDVTGTPGLSWEVKSGARITLPSWLEESEIAKINAGADFGILVIKLKGISAARAGQWAAIMPLAAMVGLLHQAGYGDAPEPADPPCRHETTAAELGDALCDHCGLPFPEWSQ